RPTVDDDALADQAPAADEVVPSLDESISTSQTHDDPGDRAVLSRIPALGGRALADAELLAKQSPGAGSVAQPASDDAAHDAATLAAEEPAREVSRPVKQGPVTVSTRLLADPGTRFDRETGQQLPPRPAHFTTV